MSFFTGFGVSALVYWLLNRVFPVPGASASFKEIDVSEDLGEDRDRYSYSNEGNLDDKDVKEVSVA